MPSTSGARRAATASDEVVELDRDRRRVDLGERQLILGAVGAEERGGDPVEREAAEFGAQLGTAQRPLAALDDDRPAGSGRTGTLIEPRGRGPALDPLSARAGGQVARAGS